MNRCSDNASANHMALDPDTEPQRAERDNASANHMTLDPDTEPQRAMREYCLNILQIMNKRLNSDHKQQTSACHNLGHNF